MLQYNQRLCEMKVYYKAESFVIFVVLLERLKSEFEAHLAKEKSRVAEEFAM